MTLPRHHMGARHCSRLIMATAMVTTRESCQYQACFCEENVYKLCEQLIRQGTSADQLFACFISNPAKQMPLWGQRASKTGDESNWLVVWDYHVIVLQTTSSPSASPSATPTATPSPATADVHGGGAVADVHGGGDHTLVSPATAGASSAHTGGERGPVIIWDLDTVLPFPCTATMYAEHALDCQNMQTLVAKHNQLTRWFRVVPALAYLTHFASDRSHMLSKPLGSSYSHPEQGSHPGQDDGSDDGPDVSGSDDQGNSQELQRILPRNEEEEEDEEGTERGETPKHEINPPGVHEDQSQWQAPRPPWPPLCSPRASCPHNLPQYWDVGPHNCVRQGHAPTCEVLVQQQGMSQWAASSSSGSVACDVDTGGGGQGGDGWWLGCVYDEEQFVRQILCVAYPY